MMGVLVAGALSLILAPQPAEAMRRLRGGIGPGVERLRGAASRFRRSEGPTSDAEIQDVEATDTAEAEAPSE
jgi:hypothetical protein